MPIPSVSRRTLPEMAYSAVPPVHPKCERLLPDPPLRTTHRRHSRVAWKRLTIVGRLFPVRLAVLAALA